MEDNNENHSAPNAKFSIKFKFLWFVIYLLGLLVFINNLQFSLNLLLGLLVFGFFWIWGSLFIMMIISVLFKLD